MKRYSLFKTQLKLATAMAAVLLAALFYSSEAWANSVGGLESLTNQQRAANGLAALVDDSRLDAAASNKAADMIAHNYWAHTSPSGVTPWYWFSAAGYSYTYAGENLAQAYFSDGGVVSAWMGSAGHRANILNPNFRNIGCGMASGAFQGQPSNLVTVCMYGATASAPAPPAPTPVPTPVSTPVAPVQSRTSATPLVRPEPVTVPAPVATPTPSAASAPASPIAVVLRSVPTSASVPAPARRGMVLPQHSDHGATANLRAIFEAMALSWTNVVTPLSVLVHAAPLV